MWFMERQAGNYHYMLQDQSSLVAKENGPKQYVDKHKDEEIYFISSTHQNDTQILNRCIGQGIRIFLLTN